MSVINRLRHKLYKAISKLLLDGKKIDRQSLYRSSANFSNSVQIKPEATVDNLANVKERIEIGSYSVIRGQLLVFAHAGKIQIGRYCYVGEGSRVWSSESIVIGDRVLISHDVNIHDSTAHSLNHFERHEHFRGIIDQGHPITESGIPGVLSSPVIIEDDVWISFGVTILRGVTIGKRSVIAAGSIVTKDVPPDSIYRCKISPKITPVSELVTVTTNTEN